MAQIDHLVRRYLAAMVISVAPAAAQANETAMDWAWLQNTYWIVPPPNLPAYLFDPSTNVLVPVSDQTVYHITSYRGGYFWGKNVTQLGQSAVTCASLVGSVTPQGRILLSFTITGSDGSVTQQQGFGEMVQKAGQWTMLNQTSVANFAHWAYMIRALPGDANWYSLPGVGVSVPSFLSQCPGTGPQPAKN